jgi:uncharacterized protein DUF1707/cell wall-active antibiotic response 4TMS protein YvqF
VDNSPERRPQPPTPELRASDADRDRYVSILRDAHAEGRLTAEEHAERVDIALSARTVGELTPLVRDLPVPAVGTGYKPATTPAGPSPLPTKSTMIAFWSGSTRKGRWRAGGKLNAIAVMGGIDIDLSEALFAEPELVINVFTWWGGVDIKIPEGVTVRDRGIGIMGGFEVREQYTDDPNAPVVVIKGVAIMAGVNVRVKRRKELRERERERRAHDRGYDRDHDRGYDRDDRPVEGDDRFRKEL